MGKHLLVVHEEEQLAMNNEIALCTLKKCEDRYLNGLFRLNDGAAVHL